MKRIITVSREHGSGGREIARRVAEALRWNLVDRALIDEVARIAKIAPEDVEAHDERVNPWLVRLAKGFWTGSADSYAGIPPEMVFDADTLARLTRHVVLDVAGVGECVILGRGAACILGLRQDALHVFIYAPLEDRLARLRARGQDEAEAAKLLHDVDRARAAFVRHYYGCDRTDRALYDLMVSSRVGEDRAVRAILAAVGRGGTTA
jgi:cytidylate kinase